MELGCPLLLSRTVTNYFALCLSIKGKMLMEQMGIQLIDCYFSGQTLNSVSKQISTIKMVISIPLHMSFYIGFDMSLFYYPHRSI